MRTSCATGLATMLLLLILATLSSAETISFDLQSQGYAGQTPVSPLLFQSQGLLLSSPTGLATWCGGQCLATTNVGGTIYGQFVLPNTNTPTTVTGLSFINIPMPTNKYTVFDAANNPIASLTQTGSVHVETFETAQFPNGVDMPVFAYLGSTPISSFRIDDDFDGVYALTFTPAGGNRPVPEPGSLILLGGGLTALAAAITRGGSTKRSIA